MLAAAHRLSDVIQQYALAALEPVGVDLKDVAPAILRLADIVASGLAVKVEHGTFTGDIDICGVRSGAPSSSPAKNG